MTSARLGLTLPLPDIDLASQQQLIRRAEQVGYESFWTGEAEGLDGVVPAALAAAWTTRARIGTGILNGFTRGPAVLAQTAAAMQEASHGRFVLGLGCSTPTIVRDWNQIEFAGPLTRLREVMLTLRALLHGERGPGGFKLERIPPKPPPIVLAALGDRMLTLAGELADGVLLNFLPISAVHHAIDQVRAGETAAGRKPGSTEIICCFFSLDAKQPARRSNCKAAALRLLHCSRLRTILRAPRLGRRPPADAHGLAGRKPTGRPKARAA